MTEAGLVVFSTAPDEDVASNIAAELVERKLAACVNILGSIHSVYWWEGQVQNDPEVLMIVKTDADHLEELTGAILELHPYDTPEVVALPIVGGAPAYLAWIKDSLGGAGEQGETS